MSGFDTIQKRFDELADMAEKVAGTVHPNADGIGTAVDSNVFAEWRTSTLSLLNRVFGVDQPTYVSFNEARNLGIYPNSTSVFEEMNAVFKSAKSDFEGGYIFDFRNLVHADVFSDELEQATHFLDQGYKVPAAVIAGTVLETTLRELCTQHPNLQPVEKLNSMNDDLAREGVYNKMRADQVRAWAKIRNSAAHGKPGEFEDGDVTRMIDGIRDFVANQMS